MAASGSMAPRRRRSELRSRDTVRAESALRTGASSRSATAPPSTSTACSLRPQGLGLSLAGSGVAGAEVAGGSHCSYIHRPWASRDTPSCGFCSARRPTETCWLARLTCTCSSCRRAMSTGAALSLRLNCSTPSSATCTTMAEPLQPRPASVLSRPVSSGLRWADRYGAASCRGNWRAETASCPCLSVMAPLSLSSAGFAPSPAAADCTCMPASNCKGCSSGQRTSRTSNDSWRACSAAPAGPAPGDASRQCTVASAMASLSRLTFQG